MIPTPNLRTGRPNDVTGIRFVDPLLRADPDRAELIRSSLAAGDCIVATDGDDILGFAVLAHYLFEKCGFVPSGRIENPDLDDDELVFFKSLPSRRRATKLVFFESS